MQVTVETRCDSGAYTKCQATSIVAVLKFVNGISTMGKNASPSMADSTGT
jgi:hypothetical protein